MYYLNRACSRPVIATMTLWKLVHLDTPMYAVSIKLLVAMMKAERTCCIKVMHVYYVHPDLIGGL